MPLCVPLELEQDARARQTTSSVVEFTPPTALCREPVAERVALKRPNLAARIFAGDLLT